MGSGWLGGPRSQHTRSLIGPLHDLGWLGGRPMGCRTMARASSARSADALAASKGGRHGRAAARLPDMPRVPGCDPREEPTTQGTRQTRAVNTSWSGQRRSFPPAMRTAILKRDRTCRCTGCQACTSSGCDQRATEADHITNHATCLRAGVDPDTMGNGQGLCSSCHAVKTQRERWQGKQRLIPRRVRQHPIDSMTQGEAPLPLPPGVRKA